MPRHHQTNPRPHNPHYPNHAPSPPACGASPPFPRRQIFAALGPVLRALGTRAHAGSIQGGGQGGGQGHSLHLHLPQDRRDVLVQSHTNQQTSCQNRREAPTILYSSYTHSWGSAPQQAHILKGGSKQPTVHPRSWAARNPLQCLPHPPFRPRDARSGNPQHRTCRTAPDQRRRSKPSFH